MNSKMFIPNNLRNKDRYLSKELSIYEQCLPHSELNFLHKCHLGMLNIIYNYSNSSFRKYQNKQELMKKINIYLSIYSKFHLIERHNYNEMQD